MKILLCFTLVLLVSWVVLFIFTKKQNNTVVYGDITHTNIVKGYAVLAILFAHVGQYAGINGIEFPGAVGVSLFLLLSGYGLTVSYEKHGLENFWKKRIGKVFLPYIVVQTIHMIITGAERNFREIALDFTLLKPLNPFGWYLSYIFICYIIFYATHKFLKRNVIRLCAIIVCFIIWFIIKSTLFVDETSFLQPRQMLAFPLGIVGADNRIKEKCSSFKYYLWFLLIVVGTGIYAFEHSNIFNVANTSVMLFNFVALGTCVLVGVGALGLIYCFSFLQNKGMIWIATISYEIYIVHGYLMGIITKQGNPLFSCIMFCMCIVGIAVILHFCIKTIDMWMRKR